MEIEVSNGMFSISQNKRKFYNYVTNKAEIRDDNDKHKYDLFNENYYDFDGNFDKEANQVDYNMAFRKFFNDSNILEIDSFLNYHYSKTQDIKTFLNYINVAIFSNPSIGKGIKVVIKQWLINEKSQNLDYTSDQIELMPNNFTLSTIEDFLSVYMDEKVLDRINYDSLIQALKHYFDTGEFPQLVDKIKVGRVNMKRFGWSLNKIFRALKTNNETLSLDYFRFAKQYISIYEKVDFNEIYITKCNLYKYFTTKTE